MTARKPKVFLDASVIFAAVLFPQGGAHKLFYLGEADLLQLLVGPVVLHEIEEVVRRKAPKSLAQLALLLSAGRIEITQSDPTAFIETAQSLVTYPPDAVVLAEAFSAAPDWFITHDREHFLKTGSHSLSFQIGTPGDLIRELRNRYSIS